MLPTFCVAAGFVTWCCYSPQFKLEGLGLLSTVVQFQGFYSETDINTCEVVNMNTDNSEHYSRLLIARISLVRSPETL